MVRKSDFAEKLQGLNHRSYEAPTRNELRNMLGQRDSFRWSKEDELTVLEELFQFSSQNNNVNYYTPQFYNHVNKMLSVGVSENQLSYIIYCLRKQYLDHQQKDDLDSGDSHVLKVLELSRKLWEVGSNDNEPKTKVLKENHEEALRVYVVEELGFGVDCLTAYVVEKIKKDWEDFRCVEDEFRMMQNRFYLQLCELKAKMHNTQLQGGHMDT